MLVSIMDADDLVLKHQAISIHNTDAVPVVPHQIHNKISLRRWIAHVGFKIQFGEEQLFQR